MIFSLSFLGVLSLALYILPEFITSVVNELDDAYGAGQKAAASRICVSRRREVCWAKPLRASVLQDLLQVV